MRHPRNCLEPFYFLKYQQRYSLQYATHASTLSTLVLHPRKHATHASTPPMQARHPSKHATHTSTNSTPFLKLFNMVSIKSTSLEKIFRLLPSYYLLSSCYILSYSFLNHPISPVSLVKTKNYGMEQRKDFFVYMTA